MRNLKLRTLVAASALLSLPSLAQGVQGREPQRATTSTEHAVDAAFAKLLGKITSADEKAAARKSQRDWRAGRDDVCSSRPDPAGCLSTRNVARRNFLEGRSVDGAKAPSEVRPFFMATSGGPSGVEISVTTLKFTKPRTPAEMALNDFMDRQSKEAVSRVANAGAPSNGETYHSLMGSELSFVSQTLLSARVDGDYFVGQAHPEPWGESINLDLRTGATLAFDDLVKPGQEKELFAFCQNQVNAKKIDKWSDPKEGNATTAEVAELTSKLNAWKFGATKATVVYGAYAFGGYGKCNCTCEIPYATLAPQVKASFPLPR